jgi:Sucrase/ferredoxin-like
VPSISQVPIEGGMSDALLWRLSSSMVSTGFFFLSQHQNNSRRSTYLRRSHASPRPPLPHVAFTQTLEGEGWDVHTQLEDPTGSPLEDYHDDDAKEAEFSRRLQELDENLPKRALILKTSHIGGHKYAGNVIVRCSSRKTVCAGC